MNRLVENLRILVREHSGVVLLAFALATAGAGFGAAQIEIDTALENLMMADDPDRAANLAIKEEFSNDEILVVAFDLGRPFDAMDLLRLGALSDAMSEIEGVEEVVSLANVEDVRADGDLLDASELVDMDTLPREIERIRSRVAGHPLYRRNLVSDDDRVLAAVIVLAQRDRLEKLNYRVSRDLIFLLENSDLPWDFHVSGYPYAEYDSFRILERDLAILTSASLIVVLVGLYWMTRRIWPVALASAFLLWTEIATLGWFGYSGTPLTTVTAALPTIVIATVSTYLIYVITLMQKIAPEEEAGPALIEMTAPSLVLAALSTGIGFLALRMMPVAPLSDLGTGLSVGIAAAALGALLLVPAAIERFQLRLPPVQADDLEAISLLGIRFSARPWMTVAIGSALGLAAFSGVTRLVVDSDPVTLWGPESSYRQSLDFVREKLAGTMPVNVIVRAAPNGGALESETLAFTNELIERIEQSPHVERTLSFLDYLALMDAALTNEREARRVLPSRELAAQYMLLYEAGGDPQDYRHYINFDRSALNIFVRVNHRSSSIVLGLREQILEWSRVAPQGVTVEVLGTGLLFPKAMAGITKGMIQGLALTALLIALVMLGFLRDCRLGIVSLVPNFLPVAVCLGLMGWMGIPLSFATAIVGCVSVGLAVDDTAHVLGHLKRGRPIEHVYRKVGRSLILTTLVLGAGFGLLAFSEFVPVAHLGVATAFTLLIALLCDLLLLPSLLVLTGWGACGAVRGESIAEFELPRPTAKAQPIRATGAFTTLRTVDIAFRKVGLRAPLAWARRLILGVVVVVVSWLWWGVLSRVFRARIAFVVYPGSRRQVGLYAAPWLARLAAPMVPLGVIRRGRQWGVYGAIKEVVTDLGDDSRAVGELLEDVRRGFPSAETIALAGRFPGVAQRAGYSLDSPFVDGVLGTVYSMDRVIRELVVRTGLTDQEATVCVLGGGGYVGRELVSNLADRYGRVIALDQRFGETREARAGIIETSDRAVIGSADVVLVLTARGEDAWMYLPYVRDGQIWGDDTHPAMSAQLQDALQSKGVDLWKAAVRDESLRLVPRLRSLPKHSTPGCLLMAAVQHFHGEAALSGIETFSKAADELGFRAHLSRHPRDEEFAVTSTSRELPVSASVAASGPRIGLISCRDSVVRGT